MRSATTIKPATVVVYNLSATQQKTTQHRTCPPRKACMRACSERSIELSMPTYVHHRIVQWRRATTGRAPAWELRRPLSTLAFHSASHERCTWEVYYVPPRAARAEDRIRGTQEGPGDGRAKLMPKAHAGVHSLSMPPKPVCCASHAHCGPLERLRESMAAGGRRDTCQEQVTARAATWRVSAARAATRKGPRQKILEAAGWARHGRKLVYTKR